MVLNKLRRKGRSIAQGIMQRDTLAAQRVRKINVDFDLATKSITRAKLKRRKR